MVNALSARQVEFLSQEHEIGERRKAPWLLRPYSDKRWVVCDTRDVSRTATIDFSYPLADGRLLSDAERLYKTVKEYAWWVRDPRYSRIDDSITHAVMVRNLMNIAHALSLRGIWSFAHLQPYDIEQLVEECRYGADALLKASERVKAYLNSLKVEEESRVRPYGGLPQYVNPATGRPTKVIHAHGVAAACHLPAGACGLPRVAALIAKAAAEHGLTTQNSRSDADPEAPLMNVTVQALQRYLDPLEQLHAMRRRVEAESIGFKPFARGAARVAAVKGAVAERTRTPPPKLALHLLGRSAEWIFERSSALLDGEPGKLDVFNMVTACWIVTAAFTARRDEELDDLRADCIRGDKESGWWLHVYIEKTLQRKEWIPVPELVARAIDVLKAISADARRDTDSDQLFQWMDENGAVVQFNVGRHLDEFAALVEVPPFQQGRGQSAPWHWHPHQFRRFFAVLYFYRFEGATIEVLSHYLRHFSLEMTKRYVTQDPEVAALWTDVEWGYMGHVARSIAAGERSVSGAIGDRLKRAARRLVDMFRRKLQIASPERIGASLTLIMQRQGLVLTPKPWVNCSCPRTHDAARKAACRRERAVETDAVGPDFARAGPSVCSNCPHAITEGSRKSFVDVEVINLEASTAAKLRAGTLFGRLEEARVIELRQVQIARYEQAAPLRETEMGVGEQK